MSGCRLNASVKDFLLLLANSPLSTIAASNAGLTGEVPDLTDVYASVDSILYGHWRSKLSQTLQGLDVSSNKLTALTVVPAGLRVDLSNNRIPLMVTPSAVAAATSRQIDVWLEGTQIANPEQLGQLLARELRLQDNYTRTVGSFACRELAQPWLRITPELFMPEEMCGCRAGYTGHATSCSPCPENTYSSEAWTRNPCCFGVQCDVSAGHGKSKLYLGVILNMLVCALEPGSEFASMQGVPSKQQIKQSR